MQHQPITGFEIWYLTILVTLVGCWFVGTHINAWCRRVKLFSRNGDVSGNSRFHAESRKQKRLLEFPRHLCSPGEKKKHPTQEDQNLMKTPNYPSDFFSWIRTGRMLKNKLTCKLWPARWQRFLCWVWKEGSFALQPRLRWMSVFHQSPV